MICFKYLQTMMGNIDKAEMSGSINQMVLRNGVQLFHIVI